MCTTSPKHLVNLSTNTMMMMENLNINNYKVTFCDGVDLMMVMLVWEKEERYWQTLDLVIFQICTQGWQYSAKTSRVGQKL